MSELIIADISAHNGSVPLTLRFATAGYTTGTSDVLGAELTTNGDMASGTTGWAGDANTTLSSVSGRLRVTRSGAGDPRGVQTLTGLIVGRTYKVAGNVYRGTVPDGQAIAMRVSNIVGLDGSNFAQQVTSGDLTASGTFTATATTHYIGGTAATTAGGQYLEMDNFTCKEIIFPANTYYDARISQPGNIQRNVFGNRSTFGKSQVGFGEVVIQNPDGALDALAAYGFAGFAITIRRRPDQVSPTWQTVLSGVMETADFSWKEISIKVRDRQQEMDKPLQQNLYGGTNSLPAGLDGTANDLKGKPKPLLYGTAYSFTPPCVNTDRQIYQINDGLINSVDLVLDDGVTVTAGAAYTSQSDMETNTPAANQYRAWLDAAGSYIRLGSNPSGMLTVDATQGAATANRTAAQLMKQVLIKGGLTEADITAADVTALDAAAGFAIGTWIGDERTGSNVLDSLANSAGAYWGVDRLGQFRMAQIIDPVGGSSIGTITDTDIISVDRVRSTDEGSGVPAWQVKLRWGRYQQTLRNTGSAAPAAIKSQRAQEWREVVANDAAVKVKFPKAVEMTFDTLITSSGDAATEVSRRFDLYKVQRETLQIRARLDDALAATVDIGKVMTVQLPRFSLGAGKKFLITGIRTDLRNNFFDLTLWG